MEFPDVLNFLLTSKGLTAYRLSKDTGISQRLIGYWKKGEKKPTSDNLQKLANYFKVSIDYLLTGEWGEPKKSPEPQQPPQPEGEEDDIDINDIMFAFSGEVKSEISQEERDAIVAVAKLARKARRLREEAKRKETNGGGQA